MLVRDTVEPFVASRASFRSKFTRQIGHAGARHGRLETVGLRDSPHGHVPAVGPSTDSEPLRIRVATLHQPVHSGHNILEISAAPIRAIALDKFVTIAGGAANIRTEHEVATSGQKLGPGIESLRPGASRTALQ